MLSSDIMGQSECFKSKSNESSLFSCQVRLFKNVALSCEYGLLKSKRTPLYRGRLTRQAPAYPLRPPLQAVVEPASCQASGVLLGHVEGMRHGAQRAGTATHSLHPSSVSKTQLSAHLNLATKDLHVVLFCLVFKFSADGPFFVFLMPALLF